MSIQNLFKSLEQGDKQSIAESLLELIDYIGKDQKAQEEVIQGLSETRFTMIFSLLEDSDTNIRKLAAKLLLDLVYDNYFVQLAFCDILGIIPADGKVCINNVPDSFKNVSRNLPECFDALKHFAFEENKGQPPYGWYLHVQEADKPDKKIVALFNSDRDLLIENNAFFDPSYSLIGFVMKGPKKENTEKISTKPRASNSIRPSTSPNELGRINLNIENPFLEKNSPNKKTQIKESVLKTVVTTKRKPLIKNPLVNLQQMSSRTMKSSFSSINNSLLTPTLKITKPDKSNNKTAIIATEAFEDALGETVTREIETEISPIHKESRIVKVRKTEPTIEPIERFNETKPNASINEVSETTSKVLDSLNSSQTGTTEGKSKTVNTMRPKKLVTEKTLTYRDKNTSSVLTSDDLSSSQVVKQKLAEIDKRSQIRTPKGTFTNNSSAVSNKSTINTNLLNKILKGKPSSKDKIQNISQINQKPGMDKTAFWEFIHAYRKLNSTALSSVLSSSTKATKTPIITSAKKEEIAKPGTADPNKKRTAQINLTQTTGPNSGFREKVEALDDELSLDTSPQANGQSSRKVNEPTLKNYHISAGFKNPIASSRVSQEIKKESLSAFGKLLSPRKSHDVSYLANHKKKIDASASIQNSKNKKVTKKVNQTVTDSPRVK